MTRRVLTRLKATGPDLALTAELVDPVLDAVALTCDVVVSTEDQDREGDILIANGVELTNHARNPVVLYEHGLTELKNPIGCAVSPAGVYMVKCQDSTIFSKTHFARHTPEGEQTYRLVEDKLLRGVSIGVRPLEAIWLPGSQEHPDGGVCLKRSEMLEYSHVVIPMNPNALVLEALSRPYLKSALLRQSLERHAPPKPVQVSVPDGVPVAKSLENGGRDYVPLQDDGTAKNQPGQAGAEEVNKTPKEESKTMDEKMDSDLLPGAQGLAALHSCLMHTASVLKEHAARQEKDSVAELMDQHAAHLDGHLSEIEKAYKDTYPDNEPLAHGMDDDDYDDEHEDGETPVEAASDEGKTTKTMGSGLSEEADGQHLVKRMARWSKRTAANTRLSQRLALVRKQYAAVQQKRQPVSKSVAALLLKSADALKELAVASDRPLSPVQLAALAHHETALRTCAAQPDARPEEEAVLKSITAQLGELRATNEKLQKRLSKALSGR